MNGFCCYLIHNVHVVLGTDKYLVLLSMIQGSEKTTFSFIKIWKKINSWSSKSLLKKELEVLIKSIL